MAPRATALVLFLSLIIAANATAQSGADREVPIHVAGMADDIHIDGVLDEPEWASVDPATNFVVYRPTEGAQPSQRSEARVLFGSSAVYVGATLYDTEPHRIRRILTRRDDDGGTDNFIAAFDSYNDRKTAYLFGVTAAGVQSDAILTGNDDDDTWDAVWYSAVRVTDEGWVVEMAIPFSQLRFTEGSRSWGLEFARSIPRTGEDIFWAPFTSDEENSGLVQLFGRLEGIRSITPRRPIQVTPYSVARAYTFEHTEQPGNLEASYDGDIGGDIKVGLSSNVTLDATINPDFGQVEADPAELNLTTFETFFEERRPFFLEGTQIFDFTYGSGDGALLYTRRVGGSDPIIGAGKVSGRLANGMSFGALGAATGTDFNPDRWYGAARVKQEFGNQNYIGGAVTGFGLRPRSASDATPYSAFAGGADWDVRVLDAHWKFEGSLAGSVRSLDGIDPSRGYALYVGFDKVRGFFTPGSGLRIYSPEFEINDVGRFRQTNLIQGRLGANKVWNRSNAVGPFLRFETGGYFDQNWSYDDGTYRGGSFNLFTGGQLSNFWYLNMFAAVDAVGGFDVRETRGLGHIRNIRNGGFNLNVTTDQRKRLYAYPSLRLWFGEDGAQTIAGSLGATWNASDRVELSTEVGYNVTDNATAWAVNEGFIRTPDGLSIGEDTDQPDNLTADDLVDLGLTTAEIDVLLAGVPTSGTTTIPDAAAYYLPVFGSRDTRNFNMSTRANVILNPKLSLQIYSQLFAARGQYDDFALLANPDELRSFPYPRGRDFSLESFQANVVLRWEYRPGSTLFVVWTQSRNLFEESLLPEIGPPGSPFDRTTGDQLRDTFGVFPNNAFLIKLNYMILR